MNEDFFSISLRHNLILESSLCPSISIKKTYSHIPILEGLDSNLVKLTFLEANGWIKSTIAPGLFFVATTIDVLSLPDGEISWSDRIKNLVVLFGSSSI